MFAGVSARWHFPLTKILLCVLIPVLPGTAYLAAAGARFYCGFKLSRLR